jgi:hypothetical protein
MIGDGRAGEAGLTGRCRVVVLLEQEEWDDTRSQRVKRGYARNFENVQLKGIRPGAIVIDGETVLQRYRYELITPRIEAYGVCHAAEAHRAMRLREEASR